MSGTLIEHILRTLPARVTIEMALTKRLTGGGQITGYYRRSEKGQWHHTHGVVIDGLDVAYPDEVGQTLMRNSPTYTGLYSYTFLMLEPEGTFRW